MIFSSFANLFSKKIKENLHEYLCFFTILPFKITFYLTYIYSYLFMHSTTFPNANILSNQKRSREEIFTTLYIYIYIFLLLPPIESSTGHLARTTNHQTRFTLNKQKCREETRNTAIALSHL